MMLCDKSRLEEATLFIATRFVAAQYYFFVFKDVKKKNKNKNKQTKEN